MKINLRSTLSTKKSPLPDFASLTRSTELQEKYAVEVSNQYNLLFPDEIDENKTTVQQQFDRLAKVLEVAYNTILPKKKKRRESQWVSPESGRLIAKRSKCRAFYRNHRNEENYQRWRESAEAAEHALQEDKLKSIEYVCSEATEAA